MSQTYIEVDIPFFKKSLDLPSAVVVDDKIFVARVTGARTTFENLPPFMVNGFISVLCCKGGFRFRVDSREVSVKEPGFVFLPQKCVVEIVSGSFAPDTDLFITAISREYMFDMKVDLSRMLGQLQPDRFKARRFDPCMHLDKTEFDILHEYYMLSYKLLKSPVTDKIESVTLLFSSTFNVLCSIAISKFRDVPITRESSTGSTRSRIVFIEFMDTVSKNYRKERSIAFYADKLCLTTKYLSKLVKEASGHSASDLIANMVINEAKNLLRYSDTAIKVISDQLNFPNQSSFNKFFKAKTGMTPLKYRNS